MSRSRRNCRAAINNLPVLTARRAHGISLSMKVVHITAATASQCIYDGTLHQHIFDCTSSSFTADHYNSSRKSRFIAGTYHYIGILQIRCKERAGDCGAGATPACDRRGGATYPSETSCYSEFSDIAVTHKELATKCLRNPNQHVEF